MLELTGSMRDKEQNCISQAKYLEKLRFFQVWRERQRNGGWTGSCSGRANFCVNSFCYICYLTESSQGFSREEKGTWSAYVTYSRSQLCDGGWGLHLNSSEPHSNTMLAALHHKGPTVAIRNTGSLRAPQPELILAWEHTLSHTL